MGKSELLTQLRLERHARGPEDATAGAGGTKRRYWIGGAAVVVLATASAVIRLAGGNGGSAATAPDSARDATTGTPAAGARPVAVDTAPARPDVLLQASGYVTARRQATVSAQITGMLVDLRVEEGDRVEQGEVLARLDNKSQAASQRVARAEARAARAQVVQLQAEVAQAERLMKRQDELLRSQLVSRQMAEQARTDLAIARAKLMAAQRQAESASAQSEMAEVALAHTEVKAPFAGVVIRKAAQVGEIVSPQSNGGFTRSGICTIVDMSSLEVDVDVNEAYIDRVAPGMRGEVVLDAYPDWRIPAHVVAIVPAADRSKATISVRIGFDQKDPRIVPDMGASVSFLRQAEDPGQAAVGAARAQASGPDRPKPASA